ncbi:hypothetical protein RQP46_004629 [Phenoliferia psychrophenolica]
MSLPFPTLSPGGQERLDAYLTTTVAGREVPALFFGATNAKETIYQSQAGERVFGQPEKGEVDADTTLQMYSMTKFVTTIACLRAVDAGILDLDSVELVEKHLPEVGKMEILEGYSDKGEAIFKPATQKITLKKLLSHNAGMAYEFNSPLIARWRKENNPGNMLGPHATVDHLVQPLIYEPGLAWNYSTGIDWAGILLSRATNKSLEDRYQSEVFARCGMTSTSFFPTEDIKSRLMAMCTRRGEDGKIILLEGVAMGRAMDANEVGPLLCGGAGLFGTAKDYLSLLRNVLAASPDNPDYPTDPLISKASFKILFTHTCPTETPLGPTSTKSDLVKMALRQNYHDPAFLVDGKGENVGHSVGLFLNLADSVNGRKAGSGCWDGAAKTQMWIDPASGLAGVCCTNLLAQNPDTYNGVYVGYERLLYDSIKASA